MGSLLNQVESALANVQKPLNMPGMNTVSSLPSFVQNQATKLLPIAHQQAILKAVSRDGKIMLGEIAKTITKANPNATVSTIMAGVKDMSKVAASVVPGAVVSGGKSPWISGLFKK